MTNISEEIAVDNNFNIIDILLIDHAYLKKCITILTNDDVNQNEKIFYARTFLDTLKKHSIAEEKTVYESLSEMDELRMLILEGEAEHGMAKFKYETLIPRLARIKVLDDVTAAEIKVLTELIENHIDEEETELFPRMRYNIDQAILNEIGFQFMILRQFTPQELKDYPELLRKIYQQNSFESTVSRKSIYQWSGGFMRKVNRYISSLVGKSSSLTKNLH